MQRTVATIAILVPLALLAAGTARAQATAGEGVFRAYCADCHGDRADGNGPRAGGLDPRPADLRTFGRHMGSPRLRLAHHVDPAPDTLGGRRDNVCNRGLRVSYDTLRFAWQLRQGTLLEIGAFLEGVQQ